MARRDTPFGRSRFGSASDLVAAPAKSFEKPCARCGQPVGTRRKRYCGPCAADRYDETVAANRAKYRAIRTASK